MLHRRFLALALSSLFVFAPVVAVPAAQAASATQTGYDGDDEVTPDDSGVSPADDSDTEPADTTDTAEAAPSTAATTSLPFTGLEAGLIAAAGLGLAGTGFVLRRAAREQ